MYVTMNITTPVCNVVIINENIAFELFWYFTGLFFCANIIYFQILDNIYECVYLIEDIIDIVHE